MKKIIFLLVVFLSIEAHAQTPQGIPYQAVVRDPQGQSYVNQNVNIQLTLHNLSSTGNIVYQEIHSVTTNDFGLFTLNFGMGEPSVGNFASIEWGNGYKFLQVECDLGQGYVDMGTQQLMSVPYALFAEKSNTTQVSVSTTGDTLHLGNGNFVIVPGISSNNSPMTTGPGSTVLPGVAYCYDKTIAVSGCNGLTELEYQGYNYELVEIAGQCWFKENLRATSFNDGSPLTYAPNSAQWDAPLDYNHPFYSYINNDVANQQAYGNFYNGWCLEDDKICPVGWHVPTTCDYLYLLSKQGATNGDLDLAAIAYGGSIPSVANNLIAHKLFSESFNYPSNRPHIMPFNSSRLNILPCPFRYSYDMGTQDQTYSVTYLWMCDFNSSNNLNYVGNIYLSTDPPGDIRLFTNSAPIAYYGQGNGTQLGFGRYIRCIKD